MNESSPMQQETATSSLKKRLRAEDTKDSSEDINGASKRLRVSAPPARSPSDTESTDQGSPKVEIDWGDVAFPTPISSTSTANNNRAAVLVTPSRSRQTTSLDRCGGGGVSTLCDITTMAESVPEYHHHSANAAKDNMAESTGSRVDEDPEESIPAELLEKLRPRPETQKFLDHLGNYFQHREILGRKAKEIDAENGNSFPEGQFHI